MNSTLLQEPPPAADPWKLSVTYAFGGLLVGRIGPVCLAIWRSKPTKALFARQRLDLASAVASDPGKVAFLCVVESSTEPPDQAVRDASVAMITSLGKRLVACACVIEGTGFRAAITRTVLTGIALVARNAPPNRFFGHVPAASAWLCEHLDRSQLTGLTEKVELARERLDPLPMTAR